MTTASPICRHCGGDIHAIECEICGVHYLHDDTFKEECPKPPLDTTHDP